MEKYRCEVCGYTYDPAEGDPDVGVPRGTPFSGIPDDWVCPLCGVGKSVLLPKNDGLQLINSPFVW